ncbi:MerR family transcriptional regulator [Actinobacteria bacterium YIM 96077]|uniref:MerR family transcriptional regulator n=2 Tax=Phytoactinopolyspora halophila TaxID=1981511 RepID=A0A329R4K1_9ACTN|nr:MerR family transcriptional regulator [Actinobacteria bacterium YIM 96077]RAW18949.1 MerR family transcriptional regulator [Phytoactinopolyspora halophila]
MQIGEVAERVGLSLRTIRYYEEVGLVPPSARTPGGFRLYTESDVARLNLIKRMKTLEFSLDEMRELLSVLSQLESIGDEPSARREELIERLVTHRAVAEERCAALRAQLETAEAFAADLRSEISRQRRQKVGQAR